MDEAWIPIVAIVGTFVWLILAIISGKLVEIYKFSRTARLKERMLESGMTAQEIERVVNAGINIETDEDGEEKPVKKPAAYAKSATQ